MGGVPRMLAPVAWRFRDATVFCNSKLIGLFERNTFGILMDALHDVAARGLLLDRAARLAQQGVRTSSPGTADDLAAPARPRADPRGQAVSEERQRTGAHS